jgi:hypothetical protein
MITLFFLKQVLGGGFIVPVPIKGHNRYIPGIDGLRAIAVLAVIAYHLDLSWAPGGLLGVVVFLSYRDI